MSCGKTSCLALAMFIGVVIPTPAQITEDEAWNRVVAQHRDSYRLRDQELAATGTQQQRLYTQRLEAFREAAARLRFYISKFVTDARSVAYVDAQYRMGLYLELAGWDPEALLFYRGCLSHPRLNDRAAVFGEQSQPLAPQVRERIAAVERRLRQHGTDVTSVHNRSEFARYSGKGGIKLRGITPPPPLSIEQSLNVAQRLSFPADVESARVRWRTLLEQTSDLNPIVEDSSVPGMLVFGVKGKAADTALVASTLDSYRRELTSRYFDAGLPAPTMVVLANFALTGNGVDAEKVGRTLSRSVHFRGMDDSEGYFESLDHSLVLRKNLASWDGPLFLGTAVHELVHALVHVDFPQAPQWLNEGIAALHEESGEKEPLDNYRLYVARAAMDAGRWPTLTQLLDPQEKSWNTEARPVMVAAARYFCMFLWKDGRLPTVYKTMRDAQASGDMSSAELLELVTGMPMAQLEARWLSDLRGRDLAGVERRWDSLREPIRRYVSELPRR